MLLSRIVPDRARGRTGRPGDTGGDVERVYVIGDIHGRRDLFAQIVSLITRDHAARGPVRARLVLLGDLIDRGPDSATLVEWCKTLTETSGRFVVLKGNHEAMMVDALSGDIETLEFWLEQGGRETLRSWGVSPSTLAGGAGSRLIREARRCVGASTLSWMDGLPLMDRHEGHVFVHAGVRPGVALEQQGEDDLLWIRGPFLDSDEDHGAIVVHGHTVHEGGPDVRQNRIGIDTGAFRTGMLTAIGIEDGETWFVSTGATPRVERRERRELATAW